MSTFRHHQPAAQRFQVLRGGGEVSRRDAASATLQPRRYFTAALGRHPRVSTVDELFTRVQLVRKGFDFDDFGAMRRAMEDIARARCGRKKAAEARAVWERTRGDAAAATIEESSTTLP